MKNLLTCNRCKKGLSFIVTAALLLSVFTFCPNYSKAAERTIRVTTTDELHQALKTAIPGDEIIVAPGIYVGKLGSASGHGSSWFNSDIDGTKDNPIILRSESREDKAILCGSRNTGNVLRITGDYWIIEDLFIESAQKGIMLDNSNYSIIRNCNVYNTGMEGIHLRDNSSYNLVENCSVVSTGTSTPDYGEGIYVGSAKNSWSTYGEKCDNNIIRKCTIGPNVAAESIDIKEGTSGTIVEECTLYGLGISGKNYADSFIDIKGNNAVIRNNICYRENSSIIVDAFQLHNQLDKWGNQNEIYNNTIYMDNDTTCYVVNSANNTSAKVYGNIRIPEGNMYKGNGITIVTDRPDISPSPTDVPTIIPSKEPVITPTCTPSNPPVPTNVPVEDTYLSTCIYNGGDVVIYKGNTYQAKWWTMGTAPDPSNQWGPWKLISEPIVTPIPTMEPVVTPIPTTEPVVTTEPTEQPIIVPTIIPTITPTDSPAHLTEWTLYTYYTKGDLVSFEGIIYETVQAHMSLPGWTPAAIPALWKIS